MKLRKITKYECVDDGSDCEFVPTDRATFEVWVNGVLIEEMEDGARPSAVRAQYYFEVHGVGLAERVGVTEVSTSVDKDSSDSSAVRLVEASMH